MCCFISHDDDDLGKLDSGFIVYKLSLTLFIHTDRLTC